VRGRCTATCPLRVGRGKRFEFEAGGDALVELEGPHGQVDRRPQGAGEGEVGAQGFDGEGVELAHFDPTVAGFGLGKKGVLGSESKP